MLARNLAKIVPAGNLRNRFEDTAALNDLEIVESGLSDEGIPFVRLENGPIFYGVFPNRTQRIVYRLFTTSKFRKLVIEDAYNVAWDIWLRYKNGGHIDQQKKYKVRPGDIVLEAGAYIGYYSLKLSEDVGPKGRVIVVEPMPNNRKIIEKNIEANQIKNITVLPYAVSDSQGSMDFYTTERQKNSLLQGIAQAKGKTQAVTIPVNSIDGILEEVGENHPDLVIITVNGVEAKAIEGMSKLFARVKPHLVVAAKYIVDGIPTFKVVSQQLSELGYELYLDHFGFVKNEKPDQQAVIYAQPKK